MGRTEDKKLIVALDVDNRGRAETLVEVLKEKVAAFKVGLELFTAWGPWAVEMVKERGGRVFLDLKFHDIPHTVARATAQACNLGVSMLDLHASGGREMMKAAVMTAKEVARQQGKEPPLLLAVTVLTSLDRQMLQQELNIPCSLGEQVVHLARMAKEAGMDGVVASPQEIGPVRSACGQDFLIVTPGVRPTWASAGDQRRILTPKEAVEAGADFLVIGRPILSAPDPVEAAERILAEIQEDRKGH
jgi:orotidine-5'-phosphate decarboxylase